MPCKVCGCSDNMRGDRCGTCFVNHRAMSMHLSYGQLQAILWDQYGDQIRDPQDPTLPCPTCGTLFLPRTINQKYCSNACAVKAAQAAYRKRKRAKALGAPAGQLEALCSSSNGSTAAPSTRPHSTRAGAGTTATPSGKEKTD